jgi:hypothetical protein
MGTLLKTPAARYVAHVALMFLGVFLSLWYAADQPMDKAALTALIAAAARAVVGAITSTNPKIGSNVV